MSIFEDYSGKAKHYAVMREAVGIEIIIGCLHQCRTPIDKQRLLDAGCGTGNHVRTLSTYLGGIVGLDINTEMLKQATEKNSGIGTANFVQTSLLERLPFVDEAFDSVLITQVLHHLGDETQEFSKHKNVMMEFYRILRPGGVLVLSASSQMQLKKSVWYFNLLPRYIVGKFAKRHIPHKNLIKLMGETGFEYRGKFVPIDAPLQGEAYFDSEGPLKEEWRNSNSIFRELTKAELTKVIGMVNNLRENKKLESYMWEHDVHRQNIGQPTFLFAIRS